MKKDGDELDADLSPNRNLKNLEKSLDWTLWNMYIINIDAKVRFDPGKALVVKQKHGIDMESVRQEILAGRFDGEDVSRVYQRRYENGELEIYR